MNPIRPIDEAVPAVTTVRAASPRARKEAPPPEAPRPQALTESHLSLASVSAPPVEEAAAEASAESRREALEARVAETNERLAETPLNVRIAWDDSWEHVVVQVLDDSEQVIEQFPSEEFLEATEQQTVPSGLLFEGKG